MIKINTPTPPKPLELPTDVTAAWANGFRFCAATVEEALTKALPTMDAQAKAYIVENLGAEILGEQQDKKESKRMKLSCKHATKYIERMHSEGKYICTLCGCTGEVRA